MNPPFKTEVAIVVPPKLTKAERQERHEWECKALVQNVESVRRARGRWQVLRAGRWRDLDPIVTGEGATR
jgi:hypothetical protein